MSFKQSYDAGDFFQRQVISHLESRDFLVETSEKFGRFGLWDLRINNVKPQQLLEVKFDLQTVDTDNVCVEVFKKDTNNEKKPGGLSETISEFYIQGYKGKPEVHFIETETLRKLVKDYEEIWEGGDDNCIFVLIPYEVFAKHSDLLFHRTISTRNKLTPSRLQQLQQLVSNLTKPPDKHE